MCTLLPIGWINSEHLFWIYRNLFYPLSLIPISKKKILWIRTSLCILYCMGLSICLSFWSEKFKTDCWPENRDFPVKANSTGKCIIFLNKRRKKKTPNIATNSRSKWKMKMWRPNYICCPYLVTCKMPFEIRYNRT